MNNNEKIQVDESSTLPEDLINESEQNDSDSNSSLRHLDSDIYPRNYYSQEDLINESEQNDSDSNSSLRHLDSDIYSKNTNIPVYDPNDPTARKNFIDSDVANSAMSEPDDIDHRNNHFPEGNPVYDPNNPTARVFSDGSNVVNPAIPGSSANVSDAVTIHDSALFEEGIVEILVTASDINYEHTTVPACNLPVLGDMCSLVNTITSAEFNFFDLLHSDAQGMWSINDVFFTLDASFESQAQKLNTMFENQLFSLSSLPGSEFTSDSFTDSVCINPNAKITLADFSSISSDLINSINDICCNMSTMEKSINHFLNELTNPTKFSGPITDYLINRFSDYNDFMHKNEVELSRVIIQWSHISDNINAILSKYGSMEYSEIEKLENEKRDYEKRISDLQNFIKNNKPKLNSSYTDEHGIYHHEYYIPSYEEYNSWCRTCDQLIDTLHNVIIPKLEDYHYFFDVLIPESNSKIDDMYSSIKKSFLSQVNGMTPIKPFFV